MNPDTFRARVLDRIAELLQADGYNAWRNDAWDDIRVEHEGSNEVLAIDAETVVPPGGHPE